MMPNKTPKKKKHMTITYKNTKYEVLNEPVLDEFTGFKIIKEREKISYIIEYFGGEEVGTISFRPTTKPMIFSISFGNYKEDRYSTNTVSARYHLVNCKLNGQYFKYNTDGKVTDMKFYSDGVDVTDDIKSFINYKGTEETFWHYEMTEDEEFNVLLRYGSHFKMLNEFNYNSTMFDDIVLNCLK